MKSDQVEATSNHIESTQNKQRTNPNIKIKPNQISTEIDSNKISLRLIQIKHQHHNQHQHQHHIKPNQTKPTSNSKQTHNQ